MTGGRINLFGWIKGQQARFDPTKWHTGGLTIVNSSPASKTRNTPARHRADRRRCVRPAPVGDTYALGGYPSLMEEILAGEKSYVKGVVTLG